MRFCKTGPSLLQEEPYQTAIPDKVIKKLNENDKKQSTGFQNSPSPTNKPKTESYDNSSKNLANFFNGEIIDLDE